MVREEPKIIGIICRDGSGAWQRVSSVESKKGDDVLLLPTEKGLVAVMGEVCDDDNPTISNIVEELLSELSGG